MRILITSFIVIFQFCNSLSYAQETLRLPVGEFYPAPYFDAIKNNGKDIFKWENTDFEKLLFPYVSFKITHSLADTAHQNHYFNGSDYFPFFTQMFKKDRKINGWRINNRHRDINLYLNSYTDSTLMLYVESASGVDSITYRKKKKGELIISFAQLDLLLIYCFSGKFDVYDKDKKLMFSNTEFLQKQNKDRSGYIIENFVPYNSFSFSKNSLLYNSQKRYFFMKLYQNNGKQVEEKVFAVRFISADEWELYDFKQTDLIDFHEVHLKKTYVLKRRG